VSVFGVGVRCPIDRKGLTPVDGDSVQGLGSNRGGVVGRSRAGQLIEARCKVSIRIGAVVGRSSAGQVMEAQCKVSVRIGAEVCGHFQCGNL
jgi:hypothetical protein